MRRHRNAGDGTARRTAHVLTTQATSLTNTTHWPTHQQQTGAEQTAGAVVLRGRGCTCWVGSDAPGPNTDAAAKVRQSRVVIEHHTARRGSTTVQGGSGPGRGVRGRGIPPQHVTRPAPPHAARAGNLPRPPSRVLCCSVAADLCRAGAVRRSAGQAYGVEACRQLGPHDLDLVQDGAANVRHHVVGQLRQALLQALHVAGALDGLAHRLRAQRASKGRMA